MLETNAIICPHCGNRIPYVNQGAKITYQRVCVKCNKYYRVIVNGPYVKTELIYDERNNE